jgi:pimeloyl-ACP methyl ester carboxylesterase
MSLRYEKVGSIQNPTAANMKLADVPDHIEVKPVQLTAEDGAPSRGLLYRPKGERPKIGVHVMHPRADLYAHYSVLPLAVEGYTVLARVPRWPNNDSTTVHELLILDVAAGIKYLKDQGCEKVVLLGHSGGGSLAAFYQAQATAAKGTRLTHTPAGDPVDLNGFDLPPADAIIVFGAHIGQGGVLGKLIDPSVVDEDDPLTADPDLDMFNPANGFVTPPTSSKYSDEFLARYRAAQMARVKRIDVKARGLLKRQRDAAAVVEKLGPAASLEQRRAAIVEHHMIVYRAIADPAAVDLSIDPDDRLVRSYHSPRPDLENYGGDNFGRFITPRAWLSTWSALSSNAGTSKNLKKVTAPVLIVHYAGDAETRMSEVQEMLEVTAASDKSLCVVRNAEHFGMTVDKEKNTRGPRTFEAIQATNDWIKERFPL